MKEILAQSTSSILWEKMANKTPPRLFLHNDYHERKQVSGPLKCCVCGCIVDSKSIIEDVHYIELDEDRNLDLSEKERIYMCGNCAHTVSDIYSDVRPLKKFAIYILIIFGVTALITIFKDIFF